MFPSLVSMSICTFIVRDGPAPGQGFFTSLGSHGFCVAHEQSSCYLNLYYCVATQRVVAYGFGTKSFCICNTRK
jgi:hypothetical protein